MKLPQSLLARIATLALAASVGQLLSPYSAQAATYTWDAGGLSPSTPAGGAGNWDTSSSYWSNGVTDTTWANTGSDVAAFGGLTSGTVTLTGVSNALGVQFLTSGYTLASGTLNLGASGIDASALSSGTTTINSAVALAANQSWNAGAGSTLAVGGIVSGANALSVTGSGALTLSGANTFTGGVTLSSGTLLLGNAAGAGTGKITLNGGVLGGSGAQTIANAIAVGVGTSTSLQGTGVLTLTGYLTGSGTLNVGSLGLGMSNSAVNSSNQSALEGFSGAINVGGALGFNSPSSGNNASYWYNLSNAALTFTSGGSTVWNSANGGSLSNCYINIGSISSALGVGTLNGPSGGNSKTLNYFVGTANTNTTFGGVITNNGMTTKFTKVGTGTLILNGTSTYTGLTTVRGGTLQVGDGTTGALSSSTGLTFLDSGAFNYKGQTAGSSQTLGALTFSQGDGTVQSTYGTSGTTALTFASLAARTAGATGNFVSSGGVNGTTNKINITAAVSGTGTLLDKGFFFGGNSYAAYDTGGFLRAYGAGDTNYATATGASGITSSATSNVALTGNVTSQASAAVNTLNMGANTLGLSGTFSTNGILVSANSASTISGGTSLAATTNAGEMVIRVDGSSDALNISTPIVANGAYALTKAGAGTLTLSGANTYTGATYVNGGTLTLSGTNTANTGILNVNNSATVNVNGLYSTTGVVTVGNGSGNGLLNVNSGGVLNLTNVLQISNSGNGSDTGNGTVTLNGGTLNTTNDLTVGLGGSQTGTLNINSGSTLNIGTTTLRWFKLGQYDSAQGVVNMNGGTLNLDFNSDIRFSVNNGAGYSTFNQNAGNVLVWSGSSTGTTGSAADGSVDMQAASSGATNTYNLNGGTLLVNQVKSSATTGTRIFNFNGGTLKAFSASAATFFNLGSGSTTANVRNSGAIIDSNGFNITISQPLVHSTVSGDNAIDGGLTKNGAGNLTLTGVNTYTGATTINTGTLTLGVANALLSSGTVNVNGGMLNVAGNNNTVGNVTLQSGVITGTTGVLSASAFAFQSGTASAILGGSGSLTKSTSGQVNLTSANTYTGSTTVNAGTLALTGTGAINGSSNIAINGSNAKFLQTSSVASTPAITLTTGTLDGTGTVGNVTVGAGTGGTVANGNGATTQLTLGSLTFGGAATLSLNMAGGATTTTPALLVSNGLTTPGASSSLTVNLHGSSAFNNGAVYDLISYGSFSGNASDFIIGTGLSGRQSGTFGVDSVNKFITLDVEGDTPVWTGANGGIWTTAATNSSTSGTPNWALKTAHTTTDFWASDSVEFNDTVNVNGTVTAPTTTAVSIHGGSVSPISTTFNNSSLDYTVSTDDGSGIASGSVTKNGTGTVTINTNNSYTGGTLVNSGTLAMTGSNSFGSGVFTVNGGVAILSGSNTMTGATSVASGVLNLQNSNALGSTSGVTVGSGGALELQGGIAIGSLPLTINGTGATGSPAGALRNVSGTNSYAGLVTLGSDATIQSDSGVLNVTNAGTITGAGMNLTLAGAGNGTLASILGTGVGGLTKNGAGTWTLTGANTYTGTTTVNAGTLAVSTNSNLGGTSAPVTLNGGTISATAAITNTHPFTVGANGGTINVTTTGQYFWNTANTLLGSGTLTLTGTGNLAANTSNLRIAQTNTFNGTLVMQNGGILEYGVAGAVDSSAPVVLNNQGELSVNTVTMPNSLTVNGGVNSVLSFENGTTGIYSGPITLNADMIVGLRDWFNYATVRGGTISGNISGNGGLSVNSGSGSGGTLTLSGSNTYTGSTTVTASTLAVTKASALANYNTAGKISIGSTSALALNVGGTGEFASGDLDSVLANVSFASGANLSLNTANATGGVFSYGSNIAGVQSLTKLGSGVLSLSGSSTYTGATTVSSGTLQLVASSSNGGGLVGGTNAAISAVSALTLNNGSGLQLNGDVNTTFTPASTQINAGTTIAVGPNTTGSNQTLTLANTTTITNSYTLTVTGSNGYTLSLPAVVGVTAGATATFNPSSGATLTIGTLTGNATYSVFNFTGAGNTNVTGAITQLQANRSDALTFNQTGAVTLSGNSNLRNNNNSSDNSHTFINLNSGTVNFNSNNAIYSDFAAPLNINASGGAVTLDNTSGNSVTLAGSHVITIGADFTYGGTNDLDLGNNATTLAATRTITTSGTATLGLSGAISGAGGLTKAGNGTLKLSNANSYTGTTTVNAGTLVVSGALNGSTDVEVASTGKLQLNTSGAITTSGTVNVNGILSLNGGSSTVGQLNLKNGSTLSVNISGTATNSHGSVSTTGGVTLATDGAGVTLSLNTTGYTPNVVLGNLSQSDHFTLTLGNGTAAVGNFVNVVAIADSNYGGATLNEYTDANGLNWAIFYNVSSAAGATAYQTAGNDTVAYAIAVPEPGTWAMMIGGLGMLITFQRSRSRKS